MVELLEAAVAEMHELAGQFGGRTRTFPLSSGFPFVVVLVDELAFLTAYQPERDLRKRAEAAIATLTPPGPVGRGVRGRRAAGPAQGRDQPAEPVLHPDRPAAG